MASNIAELFQSPEFQNAPLGKRQSMIAGVMDQGIYQARELGDDQLLDDMYSRKRELLREAGLTRMPGDIGAVENFGNAFTKSWGAFKTNIGFELLKQDHEAAVRYTDELERLNPTRDQGISDDLGSVAAQILPSAIALGAAAVPGGGAAVPVIARVATASMFGASAAGGKRGDIEEFEAKTGQEVGSIQAGFSMAGAAAGELLTEMLGMEAITRTAQATGARIFDKVAMDKLGRLAATGASKEVFNAGLKEALTTGTGRKATLAALGWVGSAGIEGVEEALSQVANNASDIFYKPMADIDPFANVGESFKGGFVGGLMLGPLAMAVEGTRMSQFRDAQIAAEREGLSELAPLLQAKGLVYTDAMHDAEAWNYPLYGAAKQMAARFGLEIYAINGLKDKRGLSLPASEAGRRVLLVDRSMAGVKLFLQVIGHEMWHGVEQQIGEGASRTMKREILQASLEYRKKYEEAIGEGTDEDTVLDEQFADLFGTMYLDPAFQQQVALHADEKTAKGIFASLRRVSEYNASVPESLLRQLNAVAAREGADAAGPRSRAATALFDTINTVLEQSKKADKAREYFARAVAAVQLAKKNQPEAVARLRQEAKQIEEERAAKEKAAAETPAKPAAPEPEPAKPIPPPEPPAQPEAPEVSPAPASRWETVEDLPEQVDVEGVMIPFDHEAQKYIVDDLEATRDVIRLNADLFSYEFLDSIDPTTGRVEDT